MSKMPPQGSYSIPQILDLFFSHSANIGFWLKRVVIVVKVVVVEKVVKVERVVEVGKVIKFQIISKLKGLQSF
jgi:hypothetical protein